MASCVVPHCDVTHENSQGYTFHSFPSNRDLKNRWLSLIGRPYLKTDKTMAVCSKHFVKRETDLKKKNYVPSLFLPKTKAGWKLRQVTQKKHHNTVQNISNKEHSYAKNNKIKLKQKHHQEVKQDIRTQQQEIKHQTIQTTSPKDDDRTLFRLNQIKKFHSNRSFTQENGIKSYLDEAFEKLEQTLLSGIKVSDVRSLSNLKDTSNESVDYELLISEVNKINKHTLHKHQYDDEISIDQCGTKRKLTQDCNQSSQSVNVKETHLDTIKRMKHIGSNTDFTQILPKLEKDPLEIDPLDVDTHDDINTKNCRVDPKLRTENLPLPLYEKYRQSNTVITKTQPKNSPLSKTIENFNLSNIQSNTDLNKTGVSTTDKIKNDDVSAVVKRLEERICKLVAANENLKSKLMKQRRTLATLRTKLRRKEAKITQLENNIKNQSSSRILGEFAPTNNSSINNTLNRNNSDNNNSAINVNNFNTNTDSDCNITAVNNTITDNIEINTAINKTQEPRVIIQSVKTINNQLGILVESVKSSDVKSKNKACIIKPENIKLTKNKGSMNSGYTVPTSEVKVKTPYFDENFCKQRLCKKHAKYKSVIENTAEGVKVKLVPDEVNDTDNICDCNTQSKHGQKYTSVIESSFEGCKVRLVPDKAEGNVENINSNNTIVSNQFKIAKVPKMCIEIDGASRNLINRPHISLSNTEQNVRINSHTSENNNVPKKEILQKNIDVEHTINKSYISIPKVKAQNIKTTSNCGVNTNVIKNSSQELVKTPKIVVQQVNIINKTMGVSPHVVSREVLQNKNVTKIDQVSKVKETKIDNLTKIANAPQLVHAVQSVPMSDPIDNVFDNEFECMPPEVGEELEIDNTTDD